MNTLEKRQVLTLAWKEWRQIRVLILLPILILVIPMLTQADQHERFFVATRVAAGFFAAFLTCFAAGVTAYGLEFSGRFY